MYYLIYVTLIISIIIDIYHMNEAAYLVADGVSVDHRYQVQQELYKPPEDTIPLHT